MSNDTPSAQYDVVRNPCTKPMSTRAGSVVIRYSLRRHSITMRGASFLDTNDGKEAARPTRQGSGPTWYRRAPMLGPFDPAAIRALTARLVACPSVSPDVEGETRCAREIESALPSGAEKGSWQTADGRPIPWCFVPGTTLETVVLLSHYDTVGVAEFAQLGDPRGAAIAFDPEALRERLI